MPFYVFEKLVPVVDQAAYIHPTASIIGDVIIEPQIRIRLESEYMTGFTEGLNALI